MTANATLAFALCAATLCVAAPRPAMACALAPPAGATVHLGEESAIIIWDAARKTQHFIRRGAFETTAKEFGFLVPTPGIPRLEEADDEAFAFLQRVTAPKLAYPEPRGGSEPPKAAAAPPPVVVVATAEVAGYDAVVLEATDAEALDHWLKDHGYASSPELVDWFKPYIAQRWRITAFRIARGAQDGDRVSARAVRMSFQAERPYFPYREPASHRTGSGAAKPRLLRIFFLGDARVRGAIGAGTPWPGQPVWSDRLETGQREYLLERVRLPTEAAPGAIWLTEFEDHSSPRPGVDDVFFTPAGEQSALKRPDVIVPRWQPSHWPLVLAMAVLLALLAGAGWTVVWVVRRVRRKLGA